MKIKPIQGIQPTQGAKPAKKSAAVGSQSGGGSLLDRLNGMNNKLESGGIAAYNPASNGIKPGGIADHTISKQRRLEM